MAAYELPEMPAGPVMELHGQRKRFHVPFGLKPLLEEITREILRYQPEDIYEFLSKYMEKKLARREELNAKKLEGEGEDYDEEEGEGDDQPRWNSLDGPDILTEEELEEMLKILNISREDADKNATKIQAAFRGHKERKSLEAKGKKLHSDHRKSWEWKKWSWEGSSVLPEEKLDEFLDVLGVDKETANKHATKIQAAFRGHSVRREMHANDEGNEGEDEDETQIRGSLKRGSTSSKRESGAQKLGSLSSKRGSNEAPEKLGSMQPKRESTESPKKLGSMDSKRGSGANDVPEKLGSMQSKRASTESPNLESGDTPEKMGSIMPSTRGSKDEPKLESPDSPKRGSMESKKGSLGSQKPESPEVPKRGSLESKRGSKDESTLEPTDAPKRGSMESKKGSLGSQKPESPEVPKRGSLESKRGSTGSPTPESPDPPK